MFSTHSMKYICYSPQKSKYLTSKINQQTTKAGNLLLLALKCKCKLFNGQMNNKNGQMIT